ncbi:ribonuclease T2-like [Leucoraja erinacea]|uniref:ribonuclease T2-like n=1 Tax=Leucoraja erinaceus TaxID=7782 RepID=UPI002457FA16|nr:ribonuclease T2-like [Leucoraja erinacea]
MGLPLLLLLLLVAAGCSGKSNIEPDNILALYWPENVCQVKGWDGPGCTYKYWTIHGWWPPKGSNSNNGAYDFNQIKDLEDLKEFWPNLRNARSFWSHEWDEHGKPAADQLTVRDYFQKGLNYYRIVQKCTTKTTSAAAKKCFEGLDAVKRCLFIYVKKVITQAHLYLK